MAGKALEATRPARQRGVALAIVLWFVAGMSLLVAGIVAQARLDTRMAQTHVARAKAAAAGDGAIQLMMVDLMTHRREAGDMPVGHYRVGELDTTVVMVPANGLIDIQSVSAEVLSALFLIAGGLSEEQAKFVADGVVQARAAAASNRGPSLDALEDLLRIPGSSRSLLDSTRDFIVAGKPGGGGTNWSMVPAPLLKVLARANPAQAEAVAARHGGAAASWPRAPGNKPRAEAAVSGTYRADAIIRYGDRIWLRRRWLTIEPSSATALPWHFTRTEAPRVIQNNSYLLAGSVDA